MKVNIYYGGRGVLDDPTIYVLNKMEEVLAELREKLERYIEINKGFRTVYLQFDFSRKY